jgi:hypothetical protein
VKRYKHVKAGEWQQPILKGYLLRCCDCALVHKMEFRVVDGKIQFRAWRAERETKRIRKSRNISIRTA